ncbi:hypothetical protein NL676_035722 [Syzygium grande]|nr:hypothetical protein NL676_035722 [Syzygium grande]
MGDEKVAMAMGSREWERDRELLIPVAGTGGDESSSSSSKPSPSSSSLHQTGRETLYKVVRSWASKKFMTGCVILFPIIITFYVTWWFIHFVDSFFSPIYAQLGIDIFGLGFVTSITFIFMVGVFMSSWLGASVLSLGEWFIKRMPFVRHIYSASKQISAAISPDQNTQAFKEVAIIRHPRIGEYAFGFITSCLVLQNYSGEEELCWTSSDQISLSVKGLKSSFQGECQCLRSSLHWTHALCRSKEVDLTEASSRILAQLHGRSQDSASPKQCEDGDVPRCPWLGPATNDEAGLASPYDCNGKGLRASATRRGLKSDRVAMSSKQGDDLVVPFSLLLIFPSQFGHLD